MQTNQRTTAFDIIDKIVSIEWLYEKVFWKLLFDLVFDRAVATNIHNLKEIYWFHNATDVFKVPIDRGEFTDLTKVIFKYQENQKPNIIWPWS
jgi:hypothetical protein